MSEVFSRVDALAVKRIYVKLLPVDLDDAVEVGMFEYTCTMLAVNQVHVVKGVLYKHLDGQGDRIGKGKYSEVKNIGALNLPVTDATAVPAALLVSAVLVVVSSICISKSSFSLVMGI